MRPTFFRTPADLRAWLEKNHERKTELYVGYYRKDSGKTGITWQQSVDEALCFGWIDGVRHRVDDERYTNRFTPRRRGSTWSAINIARAKELIAEGRMTPAGLAAFKARTGERTAIYSYEQRKNPVLDPAYERALKRNKKAWAYFTASPPSYRRGAIHWVMSAKREETRARRLATLIEDSAAGERIGPLRPSPKAGPKT